MDDAAKGRGEIKSGGNRSEHTEWGQELRVPLVAWTSMERPERQHTDPTFGAKCSGPWQVWLLIAALLLGS